MTSSEQNWHPTPELLAAYFDGECEGRDDLAPLKQRIENWLTANPRARDDLADHRRLRHLWQETAPNEPRPEQWALMFARLEAQSRLSLRERTYFRGAKDDFAARKTGVSASWPGRVFRHAGRAGAAAAVLAGLVIYLAWSSVPQEAPQPAPMAVAAQEAVKQMAQPDQLTPEDEILPVAQASEVTIVRVEGADTHTLVVGELPLQGPLVLLAPGEVVVTVIQPEHNKTEFNPVRLIETSMPIIWAKLESETDD